ncbi:MAG: hypothetical protein ACLTSX_10185 [Collinsella sp.]
MLQGHGEGLKAEGIDDLSNDEKAAIVDAPPASFTVTEAPPGGQALVVELLLLQGEARAARSPRARACRHQVEVDAGRGQEGLPLHRQRSARSGRTR